MIRKRLRITETHMFEEQSRFTPKHLTHPGGVGIHDVVKKMIIEVRADDSRRGALADIWTCPTITRNWFNHYHQNAP